jgi:hypothetical protein
VDDAVQAGEADEEVLDIDDEDDGVAGIGKVGECGGHIARPGADRLSILQGAPSPALRRQIPSHDSTDLLEGSIAEKATEEQRGVVRKRAGRKRRASSATRGITAAATASAMRGVLRPVSRSVAWAAPQ